MHSNRQLHCTTHHKGKHAGALMLLTTLGVYFSVDTAAIGQAQQSPLLKPGSHNIPPLTPQQQATLVQISRLDQETAKTFRAGQYAEAEADARQSLTLGQDSGIAGDTGGIARRPGQRYGSLAGLQGDRRRRGGQFPRNLLPYALLLLKAGHWPEAVAAYDKALPALPQDHSGSLPSVAVPFSQDAPDPIAPAAATQVALGLEDNFTCDTTGNSLHERALEEYTKAVQLRPDWDVANFYYGYGLQRLGRTTRAIAAFQKTVKLGQGPVKAAATQALKNYKQ